MAQNPDDNFKLGRYLWPIIVVGMDMTPKISKQNGQVLNRFMYEELTKEDWYRNECKDEYGLFMSLFTRGYVFELQWMTQQMSIEEMPQYDLYDNESQNIETFPSLDEEWM